MGECISKQPLPICIVTQKQQQEQIPSSSISASGYFGSKDSVYVPVQQQQPKNNIIYSSHDSIVNENKRVYSNCENNLHQICDTEKGHHKGFKNKKKLLKNEGQSESKKNSKRTFGPETKGTAMSFGFRKKLHTTPKKKSTFYCENKEKDNTTAAETTIIKSENILDYQHNEEKYNSATVISNPGYAKTDELNNTDNNGNPGPDDSEMTKRTLQSRTTVPFRSNLKEDHTGGVSGGGGSHKTLRFGFRSTNTIRPASTGITPKMTDFEECFENNNVTVNKRRSKSAHSGRSLTSYRSNDQQFNELKTTNPKIGWMSVNQMRQQQYQQQQQQQQYYHQQQFCNTEKRNTSEMMNRAQNQHHQSINDYNTAKKQTTGQYTVVNTGMHTNVIVKPTPQPATVSVTKFTLHTASLPKPQYPVPISLSTTTATTSRTIMDMKTAKQALNNTRKGFLGQRDISSDSGISSLGNTGCDASGNRNRNSTSPKKFNHGRSRNLEMVISGRHKFEVRDISDTLSNESIEPLVLPKLPSIFSTNNQTVPLSGLVRSNTILSRETTQNSNESGQNNMNRSPSDTGSAEEEKLNRDRSTTEKRTKNPSLKDYNISSKNSSPSSSRASWCNAGESLAMKDCSSLSISSSDDSKDQNNEKSATIKDENISSITMNEYSSMLSSLTMPKFGDKDEIDNKLQHQQEQKSKENLASLAQITETKFAEMADAVDTLLDDETSPTDSLVSSTESDNIVLKRSRKKIEEEIPEKDIDEISPEIELCSPLSPGTPTHASNSLSLSDVARDFLIDDEIADQPALLFNDKEETIESTPPPTQRQSTADTPTLMEILASSKKSPSLGSRRSIMHAAIELSLRTPVSLRKAALMNRTESLDTLSPCESLASDDLMVDFECHSSLDSIDRMSHSIRSHNESGIQPFDDAQIFSELEAKGNDMIREWGNILKLPKSMTKEKESINSQLPARATRLLNRSRLQPNQLNYTGSDSPKSGDSIPRKSSRSSSHLSSFRDPNSSSDDLMIHDKSFRNSMIQDVLYFKKQLLRLRRVLQEQDEDNLKRTDTLNPFELGNGQFFASCGLDFSNNQSSDEKDLGSLTSSICNDDPLQELADLRRQVVYLQGEVEDRERTIRLQKHLIEKLESERSNTISVSTSISEKECVNTATQTDRTRPLSIGPEGLARSKPTECTSYTTHFPAITTATTSTPVAGGQQTSRRHTVISTTFTNLNHTIPIQNQNSRRASIGWEKFTYKPVKTTMIGDPLKDYENSMTTLSKTNPKTSSLSCLATTSPISSNQTVKSSNNCNPLPNSCNNENMRKKLLNQFENINNNDQNYIKHQQKSQLITKCHQNRKSINFDDLHHHNEHHSHTVTIV